MVEIEHSCLGHFSALNHTLANIYWMTFWWSFLLLACTLILFPSLAIISLMAMSLILHCLLGIPAWESIKGLVLRYKITNKAAFLSWEENWGSEDQWLCQLVVKCKKKKLEGSLDIQIPYQTRNLIGPSADWAPRTIGWEWEGNPGVCVCGGVHLVEILSLSTGETLTARSGQAPVCCYNKFLQKSQCDWYKYTWTEM